MHHFRHKTCSMKGLPVLMPGGHKRRRCEKETFHSQDCFAVGSHEKGPFQPVHPRLAPFSFQSGHFVPNWLHSMDEKLLIPCFQDQLPASLILTFLAVTLAVQLKIAKLAMTTKYMLWGFFFE